MKLPIILLFLISFLLPTTTHAEAPLTAAFIRDHQLWLKQGDKEIQLTKDSYVYSPKWSYDGRFLAYIDGDEQGQKSRLFIYDTKKGDSYQPYPMLEAGAFQWSPISNTLAYVDQGLLNITKTKNGRPMGFENVSLGVGDFTWFPNGKAFLVSATSQLLPTGWGPIHLFRVPIDANLNPDKIKPFYTIQTNTSDLFAINAEYFKWSADQQWISLLATPTASWSNDSNTLCVLSATGKRFQAIGHMLGYQDWMKWAPSANQLAYISGEGRFLVENKKATIADIPIFKHQQEYTPRGYVDLDVEWFDANKIIVARARENTQWKEGPVPTMFTALYTIDIKTNEQTQLSFPKQPELDEDPQVIGTYVTWFRQKDGTGKGEIWLKDGLNGQERVWIRDADHAPEFFVTR